MVNDDVSSKLPKKCHFRPLTRTREGPPMKPTTLSICIEQAGFVAINHLNTLLTIYFAQYSCPHIQIPTAEALTTHHLSLLAPL